MKILWNLLYQYNNIYAGSYKYLKEKKNTNGRLKKKKKKKKGCSYYCYSGTWTNQSSIVATIQNLWKKMVHYIKRDTVEVLPLLI